MVSNSRIGSVATRFEPYIEELRQFFASRHLPFGSAADLPTFIDQLSDPAFREEMGSMVRSILYREDALPRIELMELLAVAVGGVGVEESSESLHGSLRQILAFVNEAAASGRGPAFSDAAPATETDEAPAEFPAATGAPIAQSGAAPGFPMQSVSVDPDATGANTQEQGRFALTNDRLSRSLLSMQEPGEAPTAEASWTPRAPVEPAAPPQPIPREPERPSLLSLLRRSYWIPGVIALLLAVAAGLLLRTRSGARQSEPAARAPSLATSGQPKPSGYGAPLSSGNPGRGQWARNTRTQPAQSPSMQTPSVEAPGAYPGAGHTPGSSVPEHAFAGQARKAPGHPSPLGFRSGAPENPLSPREGVFLASSGAMASHLLSAPAPGYPKLASLTRTEGQVIVQVVVGRDGKVVATRVLDGPRLLRGAAERAIRRWRYRPYVVEGRATDVATIVTVSFRLR